MNPRRAGAVARRVVAQFRRDRRTIALLFVAPIVVLTLVGALWGAGSGSGRPARVAIATDTFGAPLAAERLAAASGIDGRRMTLTDGQRALEDGTVEAIVRQTGAGLVIEVEGSDPARTSATIGALGRAAGDALAGANVAGAPPITVTYRYGGPDRTLLDYLAPMLIAFFAFFFIFLLAAVAFLRERTSGTLERLLASPLRRGELVAGYLLGFGLFALLQALVILIFTVVVLKVQYRGNLATIFLVEAVLVVGAVSLGLAVSAFARNELQAVQFVPLILLPQVFLSGLLVPVDQLPDVLRPIAAVLPLTYANEALRSVMIKGYPLGDPLILRDLGILAAFALLAATAAVASIRREVA